MVLTGLSNTFDPVEILVHIWMVISGFEEILQLVSFYKANRNKSKSILTDYYSDFWNVLDLIGVLDLQQCADLQNICLCCRSG